jgi:hypothetical protein
LLLDEKPGRQAELRWVSIMDKLPQRHPALNDNSRTAPWEVILASYLVVLIQAQEARIRRLEFFDRQKAVYIDEQRRRRAA